MNPQEKTKTKISVPIPVQPFDIREQIIEEDETKTLYTAIFTCLLVLLLNFIAW